MTQLTRKLKSRSGASMMLALLFFFFCLTVGAIVLTAAYANAGRNTRLRAEAQEQLAAESAARLVRDSLSKLTFVGVSTKHSWMQLEENRSTDADGNEIITYTQTYGGPSYSLLPAQTSATGEDSWVTLLRDDLKTLFDNKIPTPREGKIAPPYAPAPKPLILETELIPNTRIAVSLTLNADYSIGVLVAHAPSADPEAPARPQDNGMSFSLTPKISPVITSRRTSNSPHTEDYYIDTTTTITWTAGEIAKGGEAP